MELVLNSFGTTLQKENGMFMVRTSEGRQFFPVDKVKSISISRGAAITSDAALLAIENEIDVLFVDLTGKPLGRLWSHKYGSLSVIRKQQLQFCESVAAVEWLKKQLIEKTDSQIALLLSMTHAGPEMEGAIRHIIGRLNSIKSSISGLEGHHVRDVAASLRGFEGTASKGYFSLLSGLLPEEYRFSVRSQHPATDMFNCLLNYAYGILYGKTEGALIKAGIDPYIGILHRDEYNRPVLVYDFIEKYRVWMDYVVFGLCNRKAFTRDCFSFREDQSVWLENSGKTILIQSVNDYLDEVVRMSGISRSRKVHLELAAQALAQIFLKTTSSGEPEDPLPF